MGTAATVNLSKDAAHCQVTGSSEAPRRDAGVSILDLLIGMAILALIMVIGMGTFSSMLKRSREAADTGSTVVGQTQEPFEFPWVMVISVVGLALVGAWLFLMAQVNKAKAEQEGAELLKGTDATSESEPDGEPIIEPDESMFVKVAQPAKDAPSSGQASGQVSEQVSGPTPHRAPTKRRSGGFLDAVGEFFDLLS